jgi:hypothetical protein
VEQETKADLVQLKVLLEVVHQVVVVQVAVEQVVSEVMNLAVLEVLVVMVQTLTQLGLQL